MSHAQSKLRKLEQVKRLLLLHPEGIAFKALRHAVEADQSSINRYLHELGARQLDRGIWTLEPTQDDIDLAWAVLSRENRES